VDFTLHPGDDPRLVITPVRDGQDHVVVRARVKTIVPLPVEIPVAGACKVAVDSAAGAMADFQFDFTLTRAVNAAGVPIVAASNADVSRLTSADVEISGGIGCTLADGLLDVVLRVLRDQFFDFLSADLLCLPPAADGGAGDAQEGEADAGASPPPAICAGRCGFVRNACGANVDCGTSVCTGFDTCSGGGCTPFQNPCLNGQLCGHVPNGCGDFVNCGPCQPMPIPGG
jgi:hypothetical protein